MDATRGTRSGESAGLSRRLLLALGGVVLLGGCAVTDSFTPSPPAGRSRRISAPGPVRPVADRRPAPARHHEVRRHDRRSAVEEQPMRYIHGRKAIALPINPPPTPLSTPPPLPPPPRSALPPPRPAPAPADGAPRSAPHDRRHRRPPPRHGPGGPPRGPHDRQPPPPPPQPGLHEARRGRRRDGLRHRRDPSRDRQGAG